MSLQPICANRPCDKSGTASCGSCLLVLYCSSVCQKTHWRQHKIDCKSVLLKSFWLPQWDIKRRQPAFTGPGGPVRFNNNGKYLWGNIPAYDILNLAENEGTLVQSDLDLFFAASGDLRNVFQTLVAIPSSYGGKLQLIINDRDIDIVARNVFMMMLLLLEKDPVIAAQNVLHLWYSAFIPAALMETLTKVIEPLIRSVCTKIEHRSDDSLLGKTFELHSGNLRIILKKGSWNLLLGYLTAPAIDLAEAQNARLAVMLAPSRIDYRERSYFQADPPTRFGAHRFRERGVLLPLGASGEAFKIPNPTLFTKSGGWHLMDSADPHSGWPTPKIVRRSGLPAAPNDVFGRLYYYLVDLISDAHKRLSSIKSSIQMMQIDASELDKHFGTSQTRFDRIETANIADMGYLNPVGTVGRLAPLLKPPNVNPHATVLTLFMNAVQEMVRPEDRKDGQEACLRHTSLYLPIPRLEPFHNATIIRAVAVRDFFLDFDKYFDRYMDHFGFVPVLFRMGIEMKGKHTIIEKWPERLKKRPGEDGAGQEFQDLLNTQHTGCERYVEWRLRR